MGEKQSSAPAGAKVVGSGLLSDVVVVLHHPRHPGNVGAVARAIANFGAGELRLVAPECALEGEARARAKGGRELLAQARLFTTLSEATADGGWVVATSGIGGAAPMGYLRHPLAPWELAEALAEREGRGGLGGPLLLLFGPEDRGLTSDELAQVEALVTIPAHPGYPVLNLSHAVAVLLYELLKSNFNGHPQVGPAQDLRWRARPAPRASAAQRSRLVARLAGLAARVAYPPHKLPRVQAMLRRFIGRAGPSLWDYHTLMGFCSRMEYNLDLLEGTDEA